MENVQLTQKNPEYFMILSLQVFLRFNESVGDLPQCSNRFNEDSPSHTLGIASLKLNTIMTLESCCGFKRSSLPAVSEGGWLRHEVSLRNSLPVLPLTVCQSGQAVKQLSQSIRVNWV